MCVCDRVCEVAERNEQAEEETSCNTDQWDVNRTCCI